MLVILGGSNFSFFMFRHDFPIFSENPSLVFLDSASSAQKPRHVIDGMKHFFEHSYANVHR